MSIVTAEKPLAKVALVDWHGAAAELRRTCDSRRADAAALRQQGRRARNESDLRTRWDTYHNNVRLADRVTEVSRWRDLLGDCLRALELESAALAAEKSVTETDLERLNLNFTLANECLSARDARGGSDLCRDDAEVELKRELATLESLKGTLTHKAQAAWEQVNRLDEAAFALRQDLLDKDAALETCRSSLGRDERCANTGFKPDPLREPARTIPHEAWLERCRSAKLRADNELAAAGKLREAMRVPRERAKNDLLAQNDATNFALRRRVYETQRIKNELDWQRHNVLPDMGRAAQEIAGLERALADTADALKLAETRCEHRLRRPGAELVRDEPATGLRDEVLRLRRALLDLRALLDRAKAAYNALEDQLAVVDRELRDKNDALAADLRCLDLRARLVAPPPTQTDRNVVLTRMQDEIPPEP